MNAKETKEMIEFISSYRFPPKGRTIIDCFKKFASLEVKSVEDLFNLKETFPEFMIDNIGYFDCPFIKQMSIMSQLVDFTQFLNEYLGNNRNDSRKTYANVLGEVLPNGKNTKILDVGAGELALSSVLMHDKTHHQIDALDSDDFFIEDRLASFFNVKLINKRFKPSTDTKNYDILMGFTPCKATLTLVQNAIKNNKPYFIKYCPCGLPEDKKTGNTSRDWLNYLKDYDPNVNVYDEYIYNLDVSQSQLEKLTDKYGSQSRDIHGYKLAKEIIDDLFTMLLFGLGDILEK